MRAGAQHDARLPLFQNIGAGAEEVSSIFFGGGTPSLMEPETVDAVVSEIRWLWPWTNQSKLLLKQTRHLSKPGAVRGTK